MWMMIAMTNLYAHGQYDDEHDHDEVAMYACMHVHDDICM